MIGFLPLLKPPAALPFTNSFLGPPVAGVIPGAPGPPGLMILLRLFLLFAFAPAAVFAA